MIPRVGRNQPARACHADHFGEALGRFRDEVKDQGHERYVEGIVRKRYGRGVALAELGDVPDWARPREIKLSCRGVYAVQLRRRALLHEHLGEGAVAAADIEPARALPAATFLSVRPKPKVRSPFLGGSDVNDCRIRLPMRSRPWISDQFGMKPQFLIFSSKGNVERKSYRHFRRFSSPAMLVRRHIHKQSPSCARPLEPAFAIPVHDLGYSARLPL
jgi:hypothetical protein